MIFNFITLFTNVKNDQLLSMSIFPKLQLGHSQLMSFKLYILICKWMFNSQTITSHKIKYSANILLFQINIWIMICDLQHILTLGLHQEINVFMTVLCRPTHGFILGPGVVTQILESGFAFAICVRQLFNHGESE